MKCACGRLLEADVWGASKRKRIHRNRIYCKRCKREKELETKRNWWEKNKDAYRYAHK